MSIPVFKGKSFFNRGQEFLNDPVGFPIEQSKKLGGFFRVPFFFLRMYMITDLEGISYVLQTNQKNYVKSPAYRQLKLALGNGLVTSEGEFWRRQRRMAQPAFYKTQLEGLFKKMTAVAENYCKVLEEKCQKEATLNISKEMMGVTADIVLKTLFSSENPASQSEMYKTMWIAQEHIMYRTSYPILIPLTYINGSRWRFKKAMKLFDTKLFNILEERRKMKEQPHDLLSMLLQARDEETGEGMTNKQLRDEAITMYSAGHETSSNALSWTLYLLAQHPEIIKKVRAEVKSVLGDATPSFDDLRNLQYTRQVIEEGMRLYPPAYIVGRQAKEADEIMGHKIPKKSIFVLSISAVHQDERYWENPKEFNPDRFAPEKVKERPKLAYMPFGAGPRMCIGNHFAMMEMQLLLAMLIRQFDFELVKDHPVEMDPLVTLKPKYGIMLKMRNVK